MLMNNGETQTKKLCMDDVHQANDYKDINQQNQDLAYRC